MELEPIQPSPRIDHSVKKSNKTIAISRFEKDTRRDLNNILELVNLSKTVNIYYRMAVMTSKRDIQTHHTMADLKPVYDGFIHATQYLKVFIEKYDDDEFNPDNLVETLNSFIDHYYCKIELTEGGGVLQDYTFAMHVNDIFNWSDFKVSEDTVTAFKDSLLFFNSAILISVIDCCVNIEARHGK